ncbi:enoyl-CoA hydratase [Novosphingobium sp. CF614]|uniref:enoyl-CoA hydratase/isomerase family protein n=1 Tax=Novosphingobium sp. CF614 TaxID=1884364 RepID=UPI0008EBEF51|nr:enoyl-CoA hydratase-related protein [Novosphingobium sp. CF614]SFF96256.1 enoyl-CoA hydratase [Novosphingobium sp. CF614]
MSAQKYEGLDAIAVERRGAVLWLAMRRDHRPNADLTRIFREVNSDPDVRVVVLTGEAEKVFCVGGGGKGTWATPEERDAYWFGGMQLARDVIVAALDCEKPIVGRINGHAVGKGCSLALCCDVTVMAEEAKIGDTHVKIGLAAGDGGSLLWPYFVGPLLSRRYLLTGDLLTGKEAERIGLVTESVPRAEIDARTDYWTGRLMEGSPAAVTMTKRALSAWVRKQAAEHLDMSLGLETLTFMTEDHREGAAALTEGRPARFTGR